MLYTRVRAFSSYSMNEGVSPKYHNTKMDLTEYYNKFKSPKKGVEEPNQSASRHAVKIICWETNLKTEELDANEKATMIKEDKERLLDMQPIMNANQ